MDGVWDGAGRNKKREDCHSRMENPFFSIGNKIKKLSLILVLLVPLCRRLSASHSALNCGTLQDSLTFHVAFLALPL